MAMIKKVVYGIPVEYSEEDCKAFQELGINVDKEISDGIFDSLTPAEIATFEKNTKSK